MHWSGSSGRGCASLYVSSGKIWGPYRVRGPVRWSMVGSVASSRRGRASLSVASSSRSLASQIGGDRPMPWLVSYDPFVRDGAWSTMGRAWYVVGLIMGAGGVGQSRGERRMPWLVPPVVVWSLRSVSSTYKSDVRGGLRGCESENLGERRGPWLVPWVVVRVGAWGSMGWGWFGVRLVLTGRCMGRGLCVWGWVVDGWWW